MLLIPRFTLHVSVILATDWIVEFNSLLQKVGFYFFLQHVAVKRILNSGRPSW